MIYLIHFIRSIIIQSQNESIFDLIVLLNDKLDFDVFASSILSLLDSFKGLYLISVFIDIDALLSVFSLPYIYKC